MDIVTGKAFTLPGLTTGSVANESISDAKAVQKMMENLTKITAEFRETKMRQKLKDCQGYRVQAYQHVGQYLEGDLVWFQYLNNITWLGPAPVLCHRGQSV